MCPTFEDSGTAYDADARGHEMQGRRKSPFDEAMARASRGLDWSYPCLIWVADYLLGETGTDFAADWRGIAFDEPQAKRELAQLAIAGEGGSAVERALSCLAKRFGWRERGGAQQGAVMIGVFTDPAGEGYPAIFDGWKGWLVGFMGDATVLRVPPSRMWEIVV